MLDVLIASVVRYSASFFSLLTSLFLANSLGAKEFGAISLIIFLCTAFSAIFSFSIQRTVLITYSLKNSNIVGSVFSNYIFILVCSSFLAFFLSLIKYNFMIAISCSMLVGGLQWQLFSSSLVSINDLYSIKKNQFFFFISRLFSFVFICISSVFFSDPEIFLLIYAFFILLPFILECVLVYSKYTKYMINYDFSIVKEIKQSKWMHLDTVFSQLIIFSSSFVFSMEGDIGELGVYNLSQQIVTSSLLIISVLQVYINRLIKDNIDKEIIDSILKKIIIFLSLYAVIMITLTLFLYKYYYLIGDEFINLYIYIGIMSLAGLFSIASKIMIPILIKLSMTRFVSLTTIVGGSLGLMSSFPLVSQYEGQGAAISFVLGYLTSFLLFSYRIVGIYKHEK